MIKPTKAIVVWFTGLSGSGKTTISNVLREKLIDQGKRVRILDGDVIRESLHKSLGFSRKDIKENNRLIAKWVKDHLYRFDYILVPIISPYIEDRIMAKNIIGNKNFIELFIKTSLEKCIKRDPKGFYRKALNGEINNFIGISNSNPYETPVSPEIVVNTDQNSLNHCVDHILAYLGFNNSFLSAKQQKKSLKGF